MAKWDLSVNLSLQIHGLPSSLAAPINRNIAVSSAIEWSYHKGCISPVVSDMFVQLLNPLGTSLVEGLHDSGIYSGTSLHYVQHREKKWQKKTKKKNTNKKKNKTVLIRIHRESPWFIKEDLARDTIPVHRSSKRRVSSLRRRGGLVNSRLNSGSRD